MTLPSSPPLSMSQIAGELGQSLPLSLNDTNARNLAGITTGPISILDFLGKSTLVGDKFLVGSYYDNANSVSFVGYADGSNTLPIGGLAQSEFGPRIGGNWVFGSLENHVISGYQTSALYYAADSGGVTQALYSAWGTLRSYGDGIFDGRSIGIYQGSTLLRKTTLTYQPIWNSDTVQAYMLDSYLFGQADVGSYFGLALL